MYLGIIQHPMPLFSSLSPITQTVLRILARYSPHPTPP